MKKVQSSFVLYLFLLAGIIAHGKMLAGIVPYHNRLDNYALSAPISDGDQVQTIATYTSSCNDVKVQNIVTVGIYNDNTVFYSSPFTATVELTITAYDAIGSPMSISNQTLTVAYNPFTDTPDDYHDKSTFAFTGGYDVTVKMNIIDVNGSYAGTLPENMYIDNDIIVERYCDFSSDASTPISMNAIDILDKDCDEEADDELLITWSPIASAEEYQLEWTFVNDYDVDPSTGGVDYISSTSAVFYDFKMNSTRVTTTATAYSISNTFDHGYVLFRVRAVARDFTDPSIIIYGVWNVGPEASDLGTFSGNGGQYYNPGEHETGKNWQYSATYAEEGKKKEVISYFDGSLRNRQTVTKLNTSGESTIVGETIYDSQGRPAVSVLPVPVLPECEGVSQITAIHYYPDFNRSTLVSGVAYSKADFDIDDGSCNSAINPMSTDIGASRYYSEDNGNFNDQQKFVPDALGYPFSQVEYTPDNTGRIRRQGGVGDRYQLGSDHETKYFYGQPQQLELDRLFGSEVGNASHYKKNIVVDANGQSSITYLDMQGRTIATALAGPVPQVAGGGSDMLTALDGSGTTQSLTVDLLNKDANGNSSSNHVSFEGDALEFSTQLTVAHTADYLIDLVFEIDPYTDPCSELCFHCIYDLELTVRDECGNYVTSSEEGDGTNPIFEMEGHFTIVDGNIVFSTSCEDGNFAAENDFIVNLTPGVYTVTKKLKVNQAARDFYKQQFLDSDECEIGFSDFVDEESANLTTENCALDCSDCEASMGTREDWVALGKGTALQYDFLLEQCKEPCKTKSRCEISYEQMMADVSLDGQYAEARFGSTIDPSVYPLSVFNVNNRLPCNYGTATGHWQLPRIILNGILYTMYIDDNGNPDKILLQEVTPGVYSPAVTNTALVFYDNGLNSWYTAPENLANVSDFILRWKASWAKSLIMYHPEYAYYDVCRQYGIKQSGATQTSDEFDAQLIGITTFSVAQAQGFISGSGPYTINFTTQDPYIVDYSTFSSGIYNAASMDLTNMFTSPYLLISGFNLKLTEYAAKITRCGLPVTPMVNSCTDFGLPYYTSAVTNYVHKNDSINDAEWNLAKMIYLATKQKTQEYIEEQSAKFIAQKCNDCIGNPNYNINTAGMWWNGGYQHYTGTGLYGSVTSNPYHNVDGIPAYRDVQPCNFSNKALYYSKTKRFVDNQTDFPNSNPTAAANAVFQQTGLTPTAFAFQGILDALVQNHELTSTTVLNTYPEFTVNNITSSGTTALYNILISETSPAPSSFPATYSWTPTNNLTTHHLNVDIKYSSTVVCSIDIDWNALDALSLDLDDVLEFKDMVPTGITSGSFDFNITAMVNNPGPTPVVLSGSSPCFDLTPIALNLEPNCTPNQFAQDLQMLMSVLAHETELDNATGISVATATYTPFLTPAILSTLGVSSTTNLEWKYTSGSPNKFELYDNTTPTIKLVVTMNTGGSNIADIEYFDQYSPVGFNNEYDLLFHDVTDMTGSLFLCTGLVYMDNAGTITGVPMGNCTATATAGCEAPEYRLRDDFEVLLKDVFTIPATMPSSIDLFASPYFTNLIGSYLSGATASSSSVTTVGGSTGYIETIDFTFTGNSCALSLSHAGPNESGDPQLAFDDLVTIKDLHVISIAGGSSIHATGIFYDGTNYYEDDIDGFSCLPMLECGQCGCDGQGYALKNDFTVLLNNAFTVPATLPSSIDLVASPNFTPLIQSYLTGATASSSTVTATGTSSAYTETIDFSFTGNACTMSLEHAGPTTLGDPILSFDDLVEIKDVSVSTVTGGTNIQAIGVFNVGGTLYEDNISGFTCLPMEQCDQPPPNAPHSSPGSGDVLSYSTCLSLSTSIQTALAGILGSTPSLAGIMQQVAAVHCDACASTYVSSYLAGFSGPGSPMPLVSYTPCPTALYIVDTKGVHISVGCDLYLNYIEKVILYNDYVTTNTLTYPLLDIYTPEYFKAHDFCDCFDKFASNIDAIVNGYIVPQAYNNYAETDIAQTCFIPSCQPPVPPPSPDPYELTTESNPCADQINDFVTMNATVRFNDYIAQVAATFDSLYTAHCLGAAETFIASYEDNEYHHTLYYYDQAGNLTRTIPPEGVSLLAVTSYTDAIEQSIIADRTFGTHNVFTSHTMPTTYLYNSLNQLTKQSMPDHDPITLSEYTLPNGLPVDLNTTEIQFVSPSKGYLSGTDPNAAGHLFTTSDGGQTWQRKYDVVAGNLKKIQMIDASNGIAIGSDGTLIATGDGGLSWYEAMTYVGCGAVEQFQDVYIQGGLIGLGVCASGNVYELDLSGGLGAVGIGPVTVPSPPASTTYSFNSVTFDGTDFYIAGESIYTGSSPATHTGIIFKGSSSGLTQVTDIGCSSLSKIQYCLTSGNVPDDRGYAVGMDGTLLVTENAGTDWRAIATATTRKFTDVFFADDRLGVSLQEASAGNAELYKTGDGGQTWELLGEPGDYYNSIYFYSYDRGIAVGKNGLVTHIIANLAGSNPYYGVIPINSPNSAVELRDVCAINNSGAVQTIVVGNGGYCYYAPDLSPSSVSWGSDLYTASSDDLTDVKIYLQGGSTVRGAIVTSTGALLYVDEPSGVTVTTTTITGGYTRLANGQVDGTSDIYARKSDNKTYQLAMSSGAIVPTQVTNTVTPTGESSFDISGNNKITVVSEQGDIAVSADITVSPPVSFTTRTGAVVPLPLNDIEAYSTGALGVVGEDGTLMSITSGTTGKILQSQTYEELNAIKFFNANTSVVVGTNGTVNKYDITTNYYDPLSMSVISSNATETLNDVALNSLGDALAVGNNGTCLSIPSISSALPVASPANPVAGSTAFSGVCAQNSNNSFYAVGSHSAVFNYVGASGMKVQRVFPFPIADVHFIDANEGYLVSSQGFIRHTTNGGLTWDVVLPDMTTSVPPDANTVYTYAPGQAVIAGDGNYIGKITGNTTGQLYTAGTFDAGSATVKWLDLSFIPGDANTFYVVGSSGSGGSMSPKATKAFVSQATPVTFAAPDATNTTNGSMGVTTPVYFTSLYVFGNGTFAAAGTKGTVYYCRGNTTGNYWTKHSTTALTEDLNDIVFVDDRTGYIAGELGKFFKTTIACDIHNATTAATWTSQSVTDGIISSASDIDITRIAFPSYSEGVLGGHYNPGFTNPSIYPYLRLLKDQSGLYSTFFWYDKLGRMVISQNTKQFNYSPKRYSYTLYDALGRITEVGEKTENSSGTVFKDIFGSYVSSYYNPKVIDDTQLNSWVTGNGDRKEVTRTYYDEQNTTTLSTSVLAQQNLRKRVSYSTLADVLDPMDADAYQTATFYSYDIHGNVKTLLQDFKGLEDVTYQPENNYPDQRYKFVNYDYDLISGKVNKVSYQNGMIDQFAHKYEYDADNRITDVSTSADNLNWDHDAKYNYYAHGPLARTELGDHKVQAMDYAYTLQGWIKGVNSNLLTPDNDMGLDGNTSTGTHTFVGRDAMGYTLGYFEDDYKPIDMSIWAGSNNFEGDFNPSGSSSNLRNNRNDLFNGNISHMVTTITQTGIYDATTFTASNPHDNKIQIQGTAYKYDQLNRLKNMTAYVNFNTGHNYWDIGTLSTAEQNRYNSAFKYDANGNIETLLRYDINGNAFDDLSYSYATGSSCGGPTKKVNNRLYHVDDASSPSLYTDDIDDQGTFSSTLSTINTANNYSYDEIGNLKKDLKAHISSIDWTVYGKIAAVTYQDGRTYNFDYDPQGNRIAKHIYDQASNWKYSLFYVRDAQGNVLSVYKQTEDGSAQCSQIERHIYGSSRLGMDARPVDVMGITDPYPEITTHYWGKKNYELSNHLGNVIAVVTDRIIPRDDNTDGTVDYNEAEIKSSTDYYPFGSPMAGRTFDGTQTPMDATTTTGWTTSNATIATSSPVSLKVGESSAATFGATYPLTFTAGLTYTVTISIDMNACAGSTVTVLMKDAAPSASSTTTYTATGTYYIIFTPAVSGAGTIAFSAPGTDGCINFNLGAITMTSASEYRYAFNGKEKDDETYGDGDEYDYGDRMYDPRLGRFLSLDALASDYPFKSPYSYTNNCPISKIEIDGEWDVEVHAYKDRKRMGYAVLIVKDRLGNEVYRTVVRVHGLKSKIGKDRRKIEGDTPTGVYKILNWQKPLNKSDRQTYGPHSRLRLEIESGEGKEKRSGIAVHGGQQENYDSEKETWSKKADAYLWNTAGCMRIKDEDMEQLQQITKSLEDKDPLEKMNKLTVDNDLMEVDGKYYSASDLRASFMGVAKAQIAADIAEEKLNTYVKGLKLPIAGVQEPLGEKEIKQVNETFSKLLNEYIEATDKLSKEKANLLKKGIENKKY